MFPIQIGLKQGEVLTPFLFNFVLEYDIRRVQVNQEDLTLDGTRQLQLFVHDVDIFYEAAYYKEKHRIFNSC
jgi:hypothetical protein